MCVDRELRFFTPPLSRVLFLLSWSILINQLSLSLSLSSKSGAASAFCNLVEPLLSFLPWYGQGRRKTTRAAESMRTFSGVDTKCKHDFRAGCAKISRLTTMYSFLKGFPQNEALFFASSQAESAREKKNLSETEVVMLFTNFPINHQDFRALVCSPPRRKTFHLRRQNPLTKLFLFRILSSIICIHIHFFFPALSFPPLLLPSHPIED